MNRQHAIARGGDQREGCKLSSDLIAGRACDLAAPKMRQDHARDIGRMAAKSGGFSAWRIVFKITHRKGGLEGSEIFWCRPQRAFSRRELHALCEVTFLGECQKRDPPRVAYPISEHTYRELSK